MLDMRRLRVLHELKLRGTLSAVADALAYSPSAVSQQLAQLEREAGVPLIQKAGRRVALTPQGEVLAAHAARLLDGLEAAEAAVSQTLTSVSGTVRLAVFQSAAHAIIPRAITLVAAQHPELRVITVEREPDEALFEVSARDFDLVIAEQYPGHTRAHRSDLDRVPLGNDAIRLAMPPDAGDTPIASVDDFAASARHRPWVMEPQGTASRTWALQLCRGAGFEPDVRFETADLMAHIRLISSGNAVGLLPDLVWAGEHPSVTLRELPGNPQREVFTSARPANASRPGVVAVRAALAQAVAEIAP
ncbi:LysR family transcriptional regulator [Paramicrobacterium agarici]|uniref:DNA-binding transcriptional LysR family regulator n=1 Tax=Paramicrobacterium agarici TaxID=630514 RepID=A0A2A9DTY9_9MICO|nr:LysR family transcriptional regulator [Microbacterium agarici]PFG29380.1 DNA-binding transcriptional LysR family regulator [Microbacterium agarici]TQO22388.1 DNA-binding transcriptional LysR family regulator [Microbacterium agarici]